MPAPSKDRAERRDIHAEITNKLIAAIEADPGRPCMPWRRSSAPLFCPANALAKTLFVGVLRDCFFDPATALCLNGKTDDSRPAMAQCRPDRCPNSCITSRHRPLWAKAIADGEELMKTKRLSPLQREAIERDVRRYRKAISSC